MAVLENNDSDLTYFWIAVASIGFLWLLACIVLGMSDDMPKPPKHELKKKQKFIYKTNIEDKDDSELLCEGFKKRKTPKDEDIKFNK